MVIIAVSFLSHASLLCLFECIGVLHEHPRIGSDGESEEVSLASDPDVTSPVKMRQKNRRLSEVRRGKCSFCYKTTGRILEISQKVLIDLGTRNLRPVMSAD